MNKVIKLKNDLGNIYIDQAVEMVCKKENTTFTDAYKKGLITKRELIQNSKLKEIL